MNSGVNQQQQDFNPQQQGFNPQQNWGVNQLPGPIKKPGFYQRHKKRIIFVVIIFIIVIVFAGISKDGQFSNWSTWSTCDKTCGDGTQFRTRTYIPPVYFGLNLQDKDKLKETQKCNQGPCITSPTPSVSVPRNWAGFEYSPNNECGPFKNSKACPSGQCCSILGFCGNSSAHCEQMGTSYARGSGSIHNGLYNDTRPLYNSANLNNINWAGFGYSTNNECGPFKNNKACPNGQCCSFSGSCENSDTHCAADGSGSLSRGLYNSTKPSYYGTTPVITNWAGYEYSTNHRCGVDQSDNYKYKACPNDQCCSVSGYCGTAGGYCNSNTVHSRGIFNDKKPSNWS